MNENAANATAQTLEALRGFGGLVTRVDTPGDEYYWRIDFPAAIGADYRFVAFIYQDGEAQIGAERDARDDDEYFWYLPFEPRNFDSVGASQRVFRDKMLRLLTHESRITQRKGLFFGHFDCESLCDGSWQSLGGTSFFRFGGFRPPLIGVRRFLYSSPPVIPGPN